MTTTPPESPAPVDPAPQAETAAAPAAPRRSRAATAALGLTIGTLVAAALLGGFFIIVGDQASIAARAWLTLLLVVAFAGAVTLDANVSNGPNRWYLAASTIVNVVIVAIGLIKLWNGWGQPEDTSDPAVWIAQFGRLLLIIIVLRLALLATQLYGLHFVTRARSRLGKIAAIATLVLVWVTAIVLVLPAAFPELDWPDWWWRIAGAAALVAVVCTVIPLVVRAFEPKDPNAPKPAKPVYAPPPPQYYQVQPVQPVQYVQQQPGYPQPPAPAVQAPPPPPAPPAPPVPPAPPAPPVPPS